LSLSLKVFDGRGLELADNPGLVNLLNQALPSGSVLGSADRFGTLEVLVAPSAWVEAVRFLKEDPSCSFEMLIDLVGADYSQYPGHEGGRFGLILHLKSMTRGVRLSLKTLLEGETPTVDTLCGLYKNANFLEREVFDQYGVHFTGHPNLKRLLNHHEFVGHPLRKDYPITRRQWLSANETLMDEMDKRLAEKGWT
jgi:NADH:ubiquinone oxidoreductase subunit C